MANVLLLVHRLSYPPNKGDKLGSYHLLAHLARRHKVFLGTFVDDPADWVHVDTVRSYCAELFVTPLDPLRAKIKSLTGLLAGEPLTLTYYRDARLQAWVDRTCRNQAIDVAVIFSAAMAQYVRAWPDLPAVIEFADVDSMKWSQYAASHRWPMSWLYRREGTRLLAFERETAQLMEQSFFVTENEADLFRGLAPESAAKVSVMGNGVNAEFFSPDGDWPSPYGQAGSAVVFTGAMDYWPNIDAVTWFATEVMPLLWEKRPQLKFYIVGRSPSKAVLALAGDNVVVTGTVPDVRPYLRHADVVVAPLRVARGIQNKVLEAMAMARPVVAARACAAVIEAEAGVDLLTAESAGEFAGAVAALLDDPARAAGMGGLARNKVMERYSWEAQLAKIDPYLGAADD